MKSLDFTDFWQGFNIELTIHKGKGMIMICEDVPSHGRTKYCGILPLDLAMEAIHRLQENKYFKSLIIDEI